MKYIEKSNLYFENWKGNGVKDMFLLPARNKSWCQLMMDEGKFINTELSQLINEQGVLELENHSLMSLSEIMLPRSSLVENVIKTNPSLCVSLRKSHITIYKIPLITKWSLDLIKSLDLPTILQEERNVIKQHHQDTISKT